MSKSLFTTLLASGILIAGLAGCTPEGRQQYDSAGDSAGQTAERTGDAIQTDADRTGDAVRRETSDTGQAADQAQTSTSVKSALLLATDIGATDINVDTVGNTVYLRGRVATQEQKDRAEKLAKDTVDSSYTIQNELTVGSERQTPND